MTEKRGYKQMVDEAYAQVTTLSIADAIKLANEPSVVFVDVRDVRELEREGLIPNSFSASRGMLEFWIDPESPYHKPIFAEKKRFVFYCAAGWRSALSTKLAQDMGMENVAHIDGGFSAWKQAGGPVAEKTSKPKT
ncbi:MAG: rhodanese-like domain-containing protein [Burkholderiales bacterium]